MIARLEAEVLFSAFARRVARFELAGEPVRRRNNTLRSFARLPLRVVPLHCRLQRPYWRGLAGKLGVFIMFCQPGWGVW